MALIALPVVMIPGMTTGGLTAFPEVQDVTGQLADKRDQLQQACQNPLFSPEKPQPGSPVTPRGPQGLTPEGSSPTLQVIPLPSDWGSNSVRGMYTVM